MQDSSYIASAYAATQDSNQWHDCHAGQPVIITDHRYGQNHSASFRDKKYAEYYILHTSFCPITSDDHFSDFKNKISKRYFGINICAYQNFDTENNETISHKDLQDWVIFKDFQGRSICEDAAKFKKHLVNLLLRMWETSAISISTWHSYDIDILTHQQLALSVL